MKYYKRAGIYRASNVSFNPETCEAHSYGWWCFVRKVGGKVVFNRYRYSVSTSKHQNKVRTLLAQLGIRIDLEVSTSCSLTGAVRGGYPVDPGTAALKAAYRAQHLENAARISEVFGVRFSQKQIQDIYTELEEELCDAFLLRSIRRQEKLERESALRSAAKAAAETQIGNVLSLVQGGMHE